ncbi:MAG: hypothetical protein OEM82_12615 [Acidobacteriota bacterium]|nr:hypothetical protein [Acidobacteriota bacterium]MDH3528732.1 hypothetical protein [Acidobacteriota bacterium]
MRNISAGSAGVSAQPLCHRKRATHLKDSTYMLSALRVSSPMQIIVTVGDIIE